MLSKDDEWLAHTLKDTLPNLEERALRLARECRGRERGMRISKRGAGIGMLVPVILALAIAVITIGMGGKIIGVFLVLLYPL